jgi:hypothetical protein
MFFGSTEPTFISDLHAALWWSDVSMTTSQATNTPYIFMPTFYHD